MNQIITTNNRSPSFPGASGIGWIEVRVMASAIAMALPVAAAGAAEIPAPVVGRWLNESGRTLVEITPCGREICGRILPTRVNPGPGLVDKDADEKAHHTRSGPTLPILSGFKPEGDHWAGRIHLPESGRTYHSRLTRMGDRLKVEGCIGPFCRTQVWRRVA